MNFNAAEEIRTEGSSRSVRRLKAVLPWGIAALILYFLFSRVPLADAWAAARQARLALFLPVMGVAVGLWFLIDSAAFAFLFSRFNAKLEWSEARSLRGMTYLVTPINWNLGTAAVILHLRSSKQIGALESTSTIVLYQTVDCIVLGSCAVLGLALLPVTPETSALRNIALCLVLIQFISLAFFMGGWPRFQWTDRVRALGLFRSHRAAHWRDIGLLTLMKTLYFSVFVGIFWLGCQAFDVDVPLVLAAAAAPVILMAGGLPITPAGLGTQQAAMLYFYAPYGDEASILAFGLTFPVALLVLRALIGLPYLKDLPKLRRAMADRRAEGSAR